jgi:hypothetical protein
MRENNIVIKRAVSEAIDKATECIYIEDWWLVKLYNKKTIIKERLKTLFFIYIDT